MQRMLNGTHPLVSNSQMLPCNGCIATGALGYRHAVSQFLPEPSLRVGARVFGPAEHPLGVFSEPQRRRKAAGRGLARLDDDEFRTRTNEGLVHCNAQVKPHTLTGHEVCVRQRVSISVRVCVCDHLCACERAGVVVLRVFLSSGGQLCVSFSLGFIQYNDKPTTLLQRIFYNTKHFCKGPGQQILLHYWY